MALMLPSDTSTAAGKSKEEWERETEKVEKGRVNEILRQNKEQVND